MNNFREIDKNREKFIDRLREAVEIPSVSAQTEHRDDIFRMIDWTQKVIFLCIHEGVSLARCTNFGNCAWEGEDDLKRREGVRGGGIIFLGL